MRLTWWLHGERLQPELLHNSLKRTRNPQSCRFPHRSKALNRKTASVYLLWGLKNGHLQARRVHLEACRQTNTSDSVVQHVYSMTISQFELNTWNFTWPACWFSQATSAGGEWPTYLQRLRSLPSSLGFSRVGCFCAEKGRVRSHTKPYGSQNEGLSDPTQEAGTGERPAQQKKKKAPHPFTSLTTVLFKHHQSCLLNLTSVQPAVRNQFSY